MWLPCGCSPRFPGTSPGRRLKSSMQRLLRNSLPVSELLQGGTLSLIFSPDARLLYSGGLRGITSRDLLAGVLVSTTYPGKRLGSIALWSLILYVERCLGSCFTTPLALPTAPITLSDVHILSHSIEGPVLTVGYQTHRKIHDQYFIGHCMTLAIFSTSHSSNKQSSKYLEILLWI